nr:sodium:proton exchanger [Nocardia jiangxiensis]
MRGIGASPGATSTLLVFGGAVVAASFLLAWATEAAQVDISGGLAIAILALVAVLPEYAVDVYYAWTSGHLPEYTKYAAANMTGSNRLLMGLGWPIVVLVGIAVTNKLNGRRSTTLRLEQDNRVELGFLCVAGGFAFLAPATGRIHLLLGLALLAWFGFYLYKLARGPAEEPDLIGAAATLGALSATRRRMMVIALFAIAAIVILVCAEPFANSLINTGTELGIDRFLLVQWLAPLASEAPEFVIAVLFALRGKGTAAVATLISSKVNQWTLLVGSLPIAHLVGGGGTSLVLDARQTEELLLTAAQTLMGVALILGLRFHRWAAWTLLLLFAVQFPVTGPAGRLALAVVYATAACVLLAVNRRHLISVLAAPFQLGGDCNRPGAGEL